MSLKFTVQCRSNKIDIFGLVPFQMGKTDIAPTLVAKPMEFMVGEHSTDPKHALMTLPIKEARELANKIIRAAGKEGS